MNPDFLRQCYEAELTRKNQLASAMSPPLSASTLLGGIMVFYLSHFTLAFSFLSAAGVLALGLFAGFLARAIYFIGKAATGYTYRYMPNGSDLNEYYEVVLTACSGDTVMAGNLYRSKVDPLYMGAVKLNASNNLAKAARLAAAVRSLVVAAIFGLISAGPYVLHSFGKPAEPVKVQVTNLEAFMPNKDQAPNQQKPATNPSSPSGPSKTPPPKPVVIPPPPRTIDILEHKVPPKCG